MSHTGWSYATSLPRLRVFLIFVTQENLMPSCIMGKHSFARMTGSCVCMSKKQTTLEPSSYLITYCNGHELDPNSKSFTANELDYVKIFLILSRFVMNWDIGWKDVECHQPLLNITIKLSRWTLTCVIYWINDSMSEDCNQVFISPITFIHNLRIY